VDPTSRLERACAQCGLPLGRRPVAATVDGRRDDFCCYGCVLARQVTRARGDAGAAGAILVRLGLGCFFAMNVMMLSLPTTAPWVYGAEHGDGPLFVALRVLALVLAAPVLVLLGGPILASAWGGLRAGAANGDALIVLGTIAAYGLSAVNVVRGDPGVYVDTGAMLLVLVTLGRWLEARARAAAGDAVRAAMAPTPASATRVVDGRQEVVVPGELAVGDLVRVGPGDAFPTDGVVVDGRGGVDEAMLTGESALVPKAPGDAVAGGTCSVDGVLAVRVTAPVGESAAARIAALLEAARRERAPIQRAADRAAALLTPLATLVALAAGLYWGLRADPGEGVLAALAVLVVACPCALGIATPVALWAALATAARRGVVVRSAPVLERAAGVDVVCFDKTGTLTARRPRVVAVDAAAPEARQELLARAAALERGLAHPVARAVEWAAAAGGVRAPASSEVRVVPGLGVVGVVDGERCAAGSVRFVADQLGRDAEALAPGGDDGRILVASGGRLLGALRLAEVPRRGAARAVRELRRLGVTVKLLSGDAQAAAVVPRLVSPDDAFLRLLPEDKVVRVAALARGHRVAVVGDGLNDAPALAAAHVGIAVASATDLARQTADVVVVGRDLGAVSWLIGHSRRAMRVVRQNLAWAFGYNAVAVSLAAAGALSPLLAALAMVLSSATVVANARRLTRG
jgi:heavy metal translocating P-type ATPase